MHKIKARIQYASENLEDSPTPFQVWKRRSALWRHRILSLHSNHPLTHLRSEQKLKQSKLNTSVKAENGPIFPTKDKENFPKIDSGKFEMKIWNENLKFEYEN